MFKKIILAGILVSSLYSADNFDYEKLKPQGYDESTLSLDEDDIPASGGSGIPMEAAKGYDYEKLKVKNLAQPKGDNIEGFSVSKIKEQADPMVQMEIAEKIYSGDDYITKEEFSQVKKTIEEANQINKDGPYDFLLYFTSSSVPSKTVFNVLHGVGILQDNNVRLESKVYLIGPPDHFKEYMFNVERDLNEVLPAMGVQEKVRRNFNLKIDPRYFDHFNLKTAPAMALAKCPTIVPDIKTCDILYFMKGDISLTTFMSEISKENKKFEKYVKVLQANKIVTLEEAAESEKQ